MRLFDRVRSKMPYCLLYAGLDSADSIPALREAVCIELDSVANYTPDEVKQIRAYYTLLQRQQ